MCDHNFLTVNSEPDRCFWIACRSCPVHGPKKNTRTLALIAFAMKLVNQHPRKKLSRVRWRNRPHRP